MNGDEAQKLILLKLSIAAIRRQVNERLDALDMEITRLIPEEEGRGRRKPTLQEMRDEIDKACLHHYGNPKGKGKTAYQSKRKSRIR